MKNRDLIREAAEQYRRNNFIDPALYKTNGVKRGLREPDGTGVVAGVTLIGNVVGYEKTGEGVIPCEGHLTYRGYDLYDLVDGFWKRERFGFEEISFLLLFGFLPDREELAEYSALLSSLRKLPDGFAEDLILRSPSRDIMNIMARSTLGLCAYDPEEEHESLETMLRRAVELISRFPLLMTYAYRVKRHFFDKESLYLHFPKESQSAAESILRTLRRDKRFSPEEARLLDLLLVVHAEHGAGNNSTFACRTAASTGTDTYSAIATAVGCLKGPRHGGAAIKAAEMLDELINEIDPTNDSQVEGYLEKLALGRAGDGSGLIYGMGHAVYTLSDPRAVLLKKHSELLAKQNGFEKLYLAADAVERLAPAVLGKIKGREITLCANVDMYSGIAYRALGIPRDLFSPIFAVSRIAGWTAHRIEEAAFGGRIIRPAYLCASEKREYSPIDKRRSI